MELSHRDAKAKGWRDRPRSFAEEIAMFHSEISEALEAYRLDGEMRTYVGFEGKPEGVPVELADAIIRIAEACEHHGMDLAGAIEAKMQYNRTRPYRNGGKGSLTMTSGLATRKTDCMSGHDAFMA